MELLPESVLENVFSYLNLKQKLSVCLVCKHFNNLIGKSTSLMKDFEISFTQYRVNFCASPKLSRKYQRLRIVGSTEKRILITTKSKIFEFVDSLKENLKVLIIHHCKIDLTEFVTLLSLARKVEYLDVSDIKYTHLPNFCGYIDCPRLKYLTLDWGLLKYQIFDNYEDLIHITFSEFYDSNVRIHQIRDFLSQQKRLVEFNLKNQTENKIFDKRFCDKATFKLKSINFGVVRNCETMMLDFLNTQSNLENVELFLQKTNDDEMISVLNRIFELKHLKKFVLNLESFLDLHFKQEIEFENMEELHLKIFGCYEEHKHLRMWENIASVMPNLRKISFRQCYSAKEDNLLFLNKFKFLEQLEIDGWCRVRNLTYFRCNNLKKVKFEVMDKNLNENDWAQFFRDSPKLQEVIINGCVFSNRLWDYMKVNLKNLRKLTFGKINKSVEIEVLKKYVEKSNNFEIEMKPPKFGSFEMTINKL